MLFKKHSSHQLYLAILAVTLSSIQSVAFANQDWNCRQVNDQWDCSASISTTALIDKKPRVNAKQPINRQFIATKKAPTPASSSKTFPPARNKVISKVPSATVLSDHSNQVSSHPITAPVTDQHLASLKKAANSADKNHTPITSKTAAKADSLSNKTDYTANQLKSSAGDKQQLILANNAQSPSYSTEVEQTDIDYKSLDWYPYTSSENSQKACKGRYISPTIGDDSAADTPPDLQAVFITADQSATELGKASTLTGNVDLQQGNRSLHSPLAKLDQETGAFSLEDGVTFRQTGMLIVASKAEGNINEEETRLYDAKYVIHEKHIRGDADVIIRRSKNVLDIEKGSYTFCPPGENAWKISADKINLDLVSGFGRADNARLVLFGNSVLYLPFFYFPIDDRRQSGFLYPSIKFTSGDSSIAVPYYFNIATNMDDTLTTTLFSDGNILLENEFRYLDENSLNVLSTGFASQKSKLDKRRWVLGLNHTGRYDRITTVVDYTEVSDDDYFSDLDNKLDIDEGDNDHLNQSAKITYQANTWKSSVLLQKYQTIDATKKKPYQRLPEIRLTGTPEDNYEHYNFNHRSVFTRFDRDQTGLTGRDLTVGDRLIINPSITGEYRNSWGYIKPAVKFWHANYHLSDQPSNISSSQSVTVPILEIDSGLFFDRDMSFQGKSYTQTLEPRLYALYVPYKDQSDLPDFDTSELTFTYNSLFRDNRFSGDDRFGDAQQVSLGLTSRVISDQGREIISASVGHAFYFSDRKVRIDPSDAPIKDNSSDFATSIIWRPNIRVRALFDAAFDAGTFNNSEMTLDLKYEEDQNHVIGVRHRFTRDIRKQTTLSYLWPINEKWSSLGLVQYDWKTNDTVDIAAGFEYQSCCWKTRIVFRQELESNNKRDNSIALQFVLKGLGGIGKSPTTELRNKIKGYEKREYYNAND